MTTDPDSLIHGYLDDVLDAGQIDQLNDWIAQDPEHARRFASHALVNDRLHDRFRHAAVLRLTVPEAAAVSFRSGPRPWRRLASLLATAAVAVMAVLLVLQVASSRRTLAAQAELTRLIEVSRRATDRSYRIISLNKPQPPGRPPGRDPARVRPPIDGAILHVRGGTHYVLVRRFQNGEAFLTGSDGRESWAIPPAGPVLVSPDPTHFRGAAPGEKQNVPFQIPEALSRLRDAYDVEIEYGDSGRGVFSRLVARRRSSTERGPLRVELWFDSGSDVIDRMRFEGLPAAQGAPLSLELQLIEQRDLGPDFFDHRSHHAPDRELKEETTP